MKTRSFALEAAESNDVTAARNKSGHYKKLRPGAKKVKASTSVKLQQ